MEIFNALWKYRAFISGSVKREFQARYQNSILGPIWTILNPLSMIFIYTVVFSQIMKAKLPGVENSFGYSIYLCSGIIAWGLFTDIVGRAQNIFIEHANLIKKIAFPRMALPVIVVLNGLINFFIILCLFLLFLLVSGTFPGLVILSLIPVLFLQIFFSIALGVILGVFNVFFRDVGHLFGILLQFWFWGTPIVYPSSILPEQFRRIMLVNPMAPVIDSYQRVFVLGKWPAWNTLIFPACVTVIFCILGLRLYRKHAGEMVDEL